MSATAEASQAIHVGSLQDLPTDRVLGIYSYAHRKWVTTPNKHPDNAYYARMLGLAVDELQKREDGIAADWRASFVDVSRG